MKIKITLRGNKEIYTDLTEDEYQNLKDSLLEKAKMIEIEDRVINTSTILEIEAVAEQELISKKFRLEEPGLTEQKVRVPGGWRALSQTKRLTELFAMLKKAGKFKNFANYEEWQKAIYEKRDPKFYQARSGR